MRKTITITLELTVTERSNPIPGMPDYGSAEALLRDLKEYLTSKECPLFEDYGDGAWGGYDGAFIKKARVTSSTVSPTQ